MNRDVNLSVVLASDILVPLPALAARAEGAGLHRVWNTEFEGRDAVIRSLALGMSSTRLAVGSGIAYAFTRKPMALAAAALDVQELTGGRFTLGLGSGTRGLRASFAAQEFEPPSTRLTEVVTELRETWSKESWTRSVPPPPIAIGGVNEIMLRDAAHFGDRVVFHPLCLVEHHLHERVLPAIEAGRARRTAEDDVRLSAWCIASVDDDAELARARAKRQLAFYLSTPGYRPVVEGTPHEARVADLRDRFKAGDSTLDELADLVPDEILEQVSISGTPADVRDAVTRRATHLQTVGIDELVLQTVSAGEDELRTIEGLIDALAPLVSFEPLPPGA